MKLVRASATRVLPAVELGCTLWMPSACSAAATEAPAPPVERFTVERHVVSDTGSSRQRLRCWKVLEPSTLLSRVVIYIVDASGDTIRQGSYRGPHLGLGFPEHYPPGAADSILGVRYTRLDGRQLACRVVRRPFVLVTVCRHREPRPKPGQRTVHAAEFWEPYDSTMGVEYLRFEEIGRLWPLDPDEPPRLVRGSFTTRILALGRKTRVAGRTYECPVERREYRDANGRLLLRTTFWCLPDAPERWVRRVEERREPARGGWSRITEELVEW